jgi:hypothetical protein
MHPTSEQQPAFSLHHAAHPRTSAEKFRPPHFVHCFVGVLHDVELVIDDGAVRRPLLDAGFVRLPHVHAGRFDSLPLPSGQLRPEELVQGLFLPFPAEPQRLTGL